MSLDAGRAWPDRLRLPRPEGRLLRQHRSEERLSPNPQHSSLAAAHGDTADRASCSLRADLSAGAGAGVPANLGRISRSDAFKISAPIYSVTCAGARPVESVSCTPASCRSPPVGGVVARVHPRTSLPLNPWKSVPQGVGPRFASSGCRPSLTDARPSSQGEFGGTT